LEQKIHSKVNQGKRTEDRDSKACAIRKERSEKEGGLEQELEVTRFQESNT